MHLANTSITLVQCTACSSTQERSRMWLHHANTVTTNNNRCSSLLVLRSRPVNGPGFTVMLGQRSVPLFSSAPMQQQNRKLFERCERYPEVLTYEASSCRSTTAVAEFEGKACEGLEAFQGVVVTRLVWPAESTAAALLFC